MSFQRTFLSQTGWQHTRFDSTALLNTNVILFFYSTCHCWYYQQCCCCYYHYTAAAATTIVLLLLLLPLLCNLFCVHSLLLCLFDLDWSCRLATGINNADCGYDGGDCCKASCEVSDQQIASLRTWPSPASIVVVGGVPCVKNASPSMHGMDKLVWRILQTMLENSSSWHWWTILQNPLQWWAKPLTTSRSKSLWGSSGSYQRAANRQNTCPNVMIAITSLIRLILMPSIRNNTNLLCNSYQGSSRVVQSMHTGLADLIEFLKQKQALIEGSWPVNFKNFMDLAAEE